MEERALKLLLIEDDEDQRRFWALTLKEMFSEVVTATNGVEGLAAISQFRPDIVLSDILLPEMDGFQLCYAIKKNPQTESIPVILYSAAYIDPRDKQLAIAYGASRIIQKPQNARQVITEIENVLHEQTSASTLKRKPDIEFEASLSKLHSDIVVKKLGDTVRKLEQKKKLMEDSLNRFQDFAACTSELFWETGTDLTLTFLSSSNHNHFDTQDLDYQGRSFLECFGHCLSSKDLELLQQSMDQHTAFEAMYQWHCSLKELILKIIGKPFFNPDGGFAGYRGVFSDVTEHQKQSDRLFYEAHHDAMTGLSNKRALENRLDSLLSKQNNHSHVLCYIDLDYFKDVNDVAGHHAGDELLIQLSKTLSEQVRKTDLLVRVGGDEFVVLLEQCNLDQAQRLVEALHQTINKFRFVWKHRTFKIGASIGLAAIDNSTQISIEDAIKRADAACYAAKTSGGNRIHVHTDIVPVEREYLSQSRCLDQIHRSFEEDRFLLYKQPMVSTGNQPDACEVLVRMQNGDAAMLPSEFMPVIHRHNLFPRLDAWVIKKVLEWAREEPEMFGSYSFVSINLSGQSIADTRFKQEILAELQTSQPAAARVCFEITETAAIENLSDAVEFINHACRFGCHFALDDFGTGFSSLAYLRNLPIDYIKIDGLFVTGVADDPLDYSMLESIQQLAKILGIQTVAEFVENAEVAEKVRQVGVDFVQGDFIGMPVLLNEPRASFSWTDNSNSAA